MLLTPVGKHILLYLIVFYIYSQCAFCLVNACIIEQNYYCCVCILVTGRPFNIQGVEIWCQIIYLLMLRDKSNKIFSRTFFNFPVKSHGLFNSRPLCKFDTLKFKYVEFLKFTKIKTNGTICYIKKLIFAIQTIITQVIT